MNDELFDKIPKDYKGVCGVDSNGNIINLDTHEVVVFANGQVNNLLKL